MTIYIAMRQPWPDEWAILGVYSTQKLAEEALASWHPDHHRSIVVWTLDGAHVEEIDL